MKTIQLLSSLLLFGFWGCSSETNPPQESTLQRAHDVVIALPVQQTTEEGIVYSLTLLKTNYHITDTLYGRFIVNNQSAEVKKYTFTNLQQFGFKLVDANGNVPLTYPEGFYPAVSSMELQKGERKEYEIRGIFKNPSGVHISTGSYTLVAFLLNGNSPEITMGITLK